MRIVIAADERTGVAAAPSADDAANVADVAAIEARR
jgi:hypothetical protein